jgi:hypothetical protein
VAGASFAVADGTISGPVDLPAGVTRISATNRGTENHHLVFARLEPGTTQQDLVAAVARLDPSGVAALLGGPTGIAPGATVAATVALTPGRYVVTCLVPGHDGIPHFVKGMTTELTVTPSEASTDLPAANRSIHLGEFTIGRGGKDLMGFHPTGPVKVVNDGAQLHELAVIRIPDGTTLDDVVDVASIPIGQPRPQEPWTSIGGVSLLSPGTAAEFDFDTLDMAPGHYALICFIPSPDDRIAHAAKGMAWEFDIPSA